MCSTTCRRQKARPSTSLYRFLARADRREPAPTVDHPRRVPTRKCEHHASTDSLAPCIQSRGRQVGLTCQHQPKHLGTPALTQRCHVTAAEPDPKFTQLRRHDRLHSPAINQGSPMGANKSMLLQSILHFGQCLAHQANVGANMQRHIVSLGLDPVDLFSSYQ